MTASLTQTLIGLGLVGSLLLSATQGSAQSSQTVDVTFNVRVKVEGNIAAIDTGIRVNCIIEYLDSEGERISRIGVADILAQGVLFTPQTDDGFIEVPVTISDFPLSVNYNQNAPDGAMGWVCGLHRIDKPVRQNEFVSHGLEPISPAVAGTCADAYGYVSMAGDLVQAEARCTR